MKNKMKQILTYYDNETLGDIVGVSASQTSGYGIIIMISVNILSK